MGFDFQISTSNDTATIHMTIHTCAPVTKQNIFYWPKGRGNLQLGR